MPLDPDAERLLGMMRAAGRPPMETLSPDEARQSFAAGRAVTQPDPQDCRRGARCRASVRMVDPAAAYGGLASATRCCRCWWPTTAAAGCG